MRLHSTDVIVRWLQLVAICGFLITSPARADVEVRMATGMNIPGGDINSIRLDIPDPGLCRQACDNRNECRAWSYVKPGVQGSSAMCWLKGTVGSSNFDRNVISGVIPGDRGPAPGSARVDGSMDLGVDYNMNDLAPGIPLASGDPALCRQACDGRGDCRAWTFVKPGVQGPAALCFLKSAVGQIIPNQATISGLRGTPGTGSGGTPPGKLTGGGGTGAPVEWGVWAYRTRPPWSWSDACGIQYVASTMTSRYVSDPNYRLVRTRPGQRDADLDIQEFSAFHKDQPDGVVKLSPCNPGTQVTGPGGGGAQGGGMIRIVSGTYGGNCQQREGNTTGHLASACNGRASCSYRIDYKLIGDPAFGCRKDYVAKWTCGPGGAARQTSAGPEAGHGSTITLAC